MSGSGGSVVIVGAGVFGVSAALELCRRGHDVKLIDGGSVPHPDASSTDVSKAVRMDYGSDGFYTELAARALDGWRVWNREWDDPPFHETGILLLSMAGMDRGGFEADSFRLLRGRGVPVERLDRTGIVDRFPAWTRRPTPTATSIRNPDGSRVEGWWAI